MSESLHVAAGSSLHKFTFSEEYNVSLTIKRIYRMLEKPKSKGSMNLLPKYQNLFNCIFFVCNCNCRTIFLFCTCPNLLLICWLYLIVFYSLAVSVCVCVCVCLFIFFHREGFFWLQDVQDILERDGPTIFCWKYLYRCFCQVPSSPCLKVLNFTSKDDNILERKQYDIFTAN